MSLLLLYTKRLHIHRTMMAEKYSSLEVAPNERREPFPEVIDQAADAPERDLSGDAPELDDKSWMHQVSTPHTRGFCLLLNRLPERPRYLRDS